MKKKKLKSLLLNKKSISNLNRLFIVGGGSPTDACVPTLETCTGMGGDCAGNNETRIRWRCDVGTGPAPTWHQTCGCDTVNKSWCAGQGVPDTCLSDGECV